MITVVHVTDLWATDETAPDYFHGVMRSNRFLLLLRRLRFNNSDNRVERKKVNKLAPIRDVWETTNNKFTEFYVLSECLQKRILFSVAVVNLI